MRYGNVVPGTSSALGISRTRNSLAPVQDPLCASCDSRTRIVTKTGRNPLSPSLRYYTFSPAKVYYDPPANRLQTNDDRAITSSPDKITIRARRRRKRGKKNHLISDTIAVYARDDRFPIRRTHRKSKRSHGETSKSSREVQGVRYNTCV